MRAAACHWTVFSQAFFFFISFYASGGSGGGRGTRFYGLKDLWEVQEMEEEEVGKGRHIWMV